MTTLRHDMDDWVTVREAADAVGVGIGTIYQWVNRRHLVVRAHDQQGRQVFKYIDVLRAAQATRRRAVGQNRCA